MRSSDARHLCVRIFAGKSSGNLCLRFCGGHGVRGLSPWARLEPSLLAARRRGHRDVGGGEPGLDVLRSGAGQRTAHYINRKIPIRFGNRSDRDSFVPGPRKRFTADRRGVRSRFHPDRHRLLFYLRRILLSTSSSARQPIRVPARDAHRKCGRCFDHRAGGFPGAARAETAYAGPLSGPRLLPALPVRVRGAGPVSAKYQTNPNGNTAGLAVDSAVSCFCDVGGEMAAQSRSGNWLGIAAEDLQRIDADERHIRARAVDHSLAGLPNEWRVAAAAFLAARNFDRVLRRTAGNQPVSRGENRNFDRVLRRTAGNQPVSRGEKRECRAYTHNCHGLGHQWHGHPRCQRKIRLCQFGLCTNDREYNPGSNAGQVMAGGIGSPE